MSERMSDERLADVEQELFPNIAAYSRSHAQAQRAFHEAAHSGLEFELLQALKAEREEVERLQRRLRMADTVNRDMDESYEGKIKRTEARLTRLVKAAQDYVNESTFAAMHKLEEAIAETQGRPAKADTEGEGDHRLQALEQRDL